MEKSMKVCNFTMWGAVEISPAPQLNSYYSSQTKLHIVYLSLYQRTL